MHVIQQNNMTTLDKAKIITFPFKLLMYRGTQVMDLRIIPLSSETETVTMICK